MKLQKRITQQKTRRQYRVRNVVRATGRLRLTVFRSNKHIYAQIIDDEAGRTLVAASTAEPAIRAGEGSTSDTEAAGAIGKLLATRAIEQGIKEVAFDRGSYRYHGRVAALADAAREAGLDF
ncbi:50S ribosomal protein L18 [Planctellipticum variicoloris]|uniref:50S ribosomal protein L18 n=1 Tax=Planctellipticum variicoloris TaxID=3064265 RepID=UPI002CE6544C|nr:50S ribosomal protein L18 [Planctomycetaceae bacterium SH412]HTN01102.1 50S ribosomal protein L18 [Planctomycetaceae bacterium]